MPVILGTATFLANQLLQHTEHKALHYARELYSLLPMYFATILHTYVSVFSAYNVVYVTTRLRIFLLFVVHSFAMISAHSLAIVVVN